MKILNIAAYTISVILLVVLPIAIGIIGPSERTMDDHEKLTKQRIEECKKMGLKPVVEFLSDHAVVTGCTP